MKKGSALKFWLMSALLSQFSLRADASDFKLVKAGSQEIAVAQPISKGELPICTVKQRVKRVKKPRNLLSKLYGKNPARLGLQAALIALAPTYPVVKVVFGALSVGCFVYDLILSAKRVSQDKALSLKVADQQRNILGSLYSDNIARLAMQSSVLSALSLKGFGMVESNAAAWAFMAPAIFFGGIGLGSLVYDLALSAKTIVEHLDDPEQTVDE